MLWWVIISRKRKIVLEKQRKGKNVMRRQVGNVEHQIPPTGLIMAVLKTGTIKLYSFKRLKRCPKMVYLASS